MTNQSDSNAVNKALNNIQERLLEKGNRHRDTALKEIDAHARGYLSGVFDTLEMVEAAEHQAQNAPARPRTNLDRIRAASVEEIALLVMHANRCRYCSLCGEDGRCEKNVVYSTKCAAALVKWLNSPVKEDGND